MSWNQVIGQERAKAILRNSLRQGRLAHAYLLSGQEGVGQEPLALELARVLNCEQAGLEACDTCRSCRSAALLRHPNIHLIFPLPVGKNEDTGDPPLAKLSDDELAAVREQIALKAANPYRKIRVPRGNTIKINSIREIRREASLTSFSEGMKVFIVLDADEMSDESANALLKTLEEPPGDTLIVLTTSHPDSLPPTILSRCQLIRCGPISRAEIAAALESREGLPRADAERIARNAEGSFARALVLKDSGGDGRQEDILEFLATALSGTRRQILQSLEEFSAGLERPQIADALQVLRSRLREAMLMREARTDDSGDEVLRQIVGEHPEADFAAAGRAVERSLSLLERNVYIPLILLNLVFALREGIVHRADPKPGRR